MTNKEQYRDRITETTNLLVLLADSLYDAYYADYESGGTGRYRVILWATYRCVRKAVQFMHKAAAEINKQ